MWPHVAGVLVALGAQATIYLGLRQMATATMPAWAHHHQATRPGPLPWPAVVPVDVVQGGDAARDVPPPLPLPVLVPAPAIGLPPPPLIMNR